MDQDCLLKSLKRVLHPIFLSAKVNPYYKLLTWGINVLYVDDDELGENPLMTYQLRAQVMYPNSRYINPVNNDSTADRINLTSTT